MKVLVTGASGFTGSHLVKALEARGNQVVALVRQSSPNRDRLAQTNAQLIDGDISDRAALEKAMADVSMIFHTAAYVDLGLVDADRMARVNVDGTRAVLETAAQMFPVPKLIYCSTIGIYGDTTGTVVDETFVRTQRDFSSAYDRTKYDAQQLVDAAAAQGQPVVSVMPVGIFGPGDPHFGPVIRLFLNGKLKFWPGGDRITGIVHVDDLVSAMILAGEQAPSGEHYIISAGELSTTEMFRILGKQANVSVPREPPQALVRLLGNFLDPVGRLLSINPLLSRERVHYIYDRCVRVSATKARQELGWQPRSIREILLDILKQGP